MAAGVVVDIIRSKEMASKTLLMVGPQEMVRLTLLSQSLLSLAFRLPSALNSAPKSRILKPSERISDAP